MRRLLVWLGATVSLVMGLGCGDDGSVSACVPGQSVACTGAGGCAGGQVCLPDGSGFGACECGSDDAGTDSGVDGGSDPTDGGSDPTDGGTDMGEPVPSFQYVVSELLYPTTNAQAEVYGLDLDGDGDVDNQFGIVEATLTAQAGAAPLGPWLVPSTDHPLVERGRVIILAELRTSSFDLASDVQLRFHIGTNPDPAPCLIPGEISTCGQHLDGGGTFDVVPVSPSDAPVLGTLGGGEFSTRDPGTVTLRFHLVDGEPPLEIRLLGARAELGATETGLNGKLGGAVTDEELRGSFLPALQRQFSSVLSVDCVGTAPACCADPESTGKLLLDLYDQDGDCAISVEEVETNSLVSSLWVPDLDLFDAEGNFMVGGDGVNDSWSVGFGFTAVGATFTAPD